MEIVPTLDRRVPTGPAKDDVRQRHIVSDGRRQTEGGTRTDRPAHHASSYHWHADRVWSKQTFAAHLIVSQTRLPSKLAGFYPISIPLATFRVCHHQNTYAPLNPL